MEKLTTSKAKKSKGGRPRVDATPVMVRVPPAQLQRLDSWIAAQGRDDPGRPEAIRRLLDLALGAASSPSLEQQIAKQAQKLARKIPAKIGPQRGHAIMRKGLAEVEHRKLLAEQKSRGRKSAADPEAERRPAQASGKRGSEAQNARLTRRAFVELAAKTKPRRGQT
jgi:hypothetical protein